MPNVNVDLSVKVLVNAIKKLSKKELNELSILLSKDGKELLKRKKEIESGEVKALSEKEVFDV